MPLTPEFFNVAANLVPVLLIALAVERFALDSEDSDDGGFRWGLVAIAVLVLAECLSLGVIAAGSSNRLVDSLTLAAVAFGLMAVAMTYTELLFQTFPDRNGSRRSRGLDFLILMTAVLAPLGLLVWAYARIWA
ncbi:hypothetical protein [Aeromicrobium sp. Root495]|uniref:hypothetical protein n=1 Tax=Aeromicrobium sp. Root495 TaxID=1736550 RepID=UPI0012E83364|nr:hypothetical protein [Aeromicrobium sp. Root495]